MTTKFRSKKPPAKPVRPYDVHDDPLSLAMMPPDDESPEDRALRLEQQQEATRVSREIDEGLLESKRAYEKRKKAIKVLLLGGLSMRSCSTILRLVRRLPSSRPSRIRKEYYVEELPASVYSKSLSIRKGGMENDHSAQSHLLDQEASGGFAG
jgi:hypothetical protein